MRPVIRGMFHMDRLFDGTLDLEQIALANDALDVVDENERRIAEATKR